MPQLQIVCIGVDLPPLDGLQHVNLLSNQSLLDADIIVVRPTFADLERSGSFQGLPLIDDDDSFRVKNAHAEWWGRITNALNAGRTVIYMLPPLEKVAVDTGQREHSGTGRNRQTTKIVGSFDNYKFLPVEKMRDKLTFETGSNIRPAKDIGPLATIYDAFKGRWRYHCFFESDAMRPALVTKAGQHCVGAIGRTSGVIIPDIQFSSSDLWKWVNAYSRQGTPEGKKCAHEFRDQLIALHHALKSDRETTPPPAWARSSEYRLPSEVKLETKLQAIDEQVSALQLRRAELQAELDEAGQLRELLFGTGKSLERAVQKALEMLGFSVSRFDDGDSEFDVVFESDEGRFIGEAEGRDAKAIDVTKISQVRRNVDEDFAREEVDAPARAVLFGNGYRLNEPPQRAELFTRKVVSAAPALRVTLVRTTDLFAAVRYYLQSNDDEFARQCRIAIAEGEGEVVKFPNLEEAFPAETILQPQAGDDTTAAPEGPSSTL